MPGFWRVRPSIWEPKVVSRWRVRPDRLGALEFNVLQYLWMGAGVG